MDKKKHTAILQEKYEELAVVWDKYRETTRTTKHMKQIHIMARRVLKENRRYSEQVQPSY